MPIEWTTIFLIFITSRWVYILAKRFNKRLFTYTLIAVATYLVGGAILSFVATFSLMMIYGEFAFNYEMLIAGFFALLGAASVAIYRTILLRRWKKEAKTQRDTDVLDDGIK